MKTRYECVKCGKIVEVENGEKIPECCGEPMNVCLKTLSAEDYRSSDNDDACDDGRSGSRR